MNEKLLASIRFYFAQSVFNSNCHFKARNRLEKKERRISFAICTISAMTIISLILQIVGFEGNCQLIIRIAAYLGLFSTAGSLICDRFFKSDRIQQIFMHKLCAEKYKALRDEYIGLIEEAMSNSIPEEQIRIKRDSFQKSYSSTGENAPNTDTNDYELAQIGLGISKSDKEEFTWSDSEIDKFLPRHLRLG